MKMLKKYAIIEVDPESSIDMQKLIGHCANKETFRREIEKRYGGIESINHNEDPINHLPKNEVSNFDWVLRTSEDGKMIELLEKKEIKRYLLSPLFSYDEMVCIRKWKIIYVSFGIILKDYIKRQGKEE